MLESEQGGLKAQRLFTARCEEDKIIFNVDVPEPVSVAAT
jgi:hypothetical protein